jgi:glycosyltransferase involved in cell wall biosynthesis
VNIHLICKRYYTNKDLIRDRFGRLFHLPTQMSEQGACVSVNAIDYRNSQPTQLEHAGVTFTTVPATLRRLPGLIPNLFRAARAARPQIVIASGDSHIGFVALQIARRIGARFVFDAYDFYPAFAGNRIPGMKAMFGTAVKQSDLVLCASQSLCERLRPENRNVLLIENGVDTEQFKPGNMGEARAVLGIPAHHPVIGYFGSITSSRGPLLIEACRILRQERPGLRLLLAGRNDGIDIGERWITYLGERAQHDIPALINACDVVAIPYANDAFNSMAGACKIAEYLACEKPVVATRVSSHAAVFEDHEAMLCEPDADDMARALQSQLDDPCRHPLPERMRWEWIAETLLDRLRSLR